MKSYSLSKVPTFFINFLIIELLSTYSEIQFNYSLQYYIIFTHVFHVKNSCLKIRKILSAVELLRN